MSQLTAEELRHINELRKEREKIDGTSKIDWMYNESSDKPTDEDYLLGKPITDPKKNHVEYECVPPSIKNACLPQEINVDVQRKMQEDPLYEIKRREIEARKQMLMNPTRLKKLREAVQGRQEASDDDLEKKIIEKFLELKKKKKHKKKERDHDASDKWVEKKKGKKSKERRDSSSDSSLERKPKKSRNKEKKRHSKVEKSRNTPERKSKYKREKSESRYRRKSRSISRERRTTKKRESSNEERSYTPKMKHPNQMHSQTRRRDSSSSSSDTKSRNRRRKTSKSPSKNSRNKRRNKSSSSENEPKNDHKNRRVRSPVKKGKLTAAEKERKLKEMMDNAEWRKELSGTFKRKEQTEITVKEYEDNPDFIKKHLLKGLYTSVEERTRSKIYTLQKGQGYMDKNFSRR